MVISFPAGRPAVSHIVELRLLFVAQRREEGSECRMQAFSRYRSLRPASRSRLRTVSTSNLPDARDRLVIARAVSPSQNIIPDIRALSSWGAESKIRPTNRVGTLWFAISPCDQPSGRRGPLSFVSGCIRRRWGTARRPWRRDSRIRVFAHKRRPRSAWDRRPCGACPLRA